MQDLQQSTNTANATATATVTVTVIVTVGETQFTCPQDRENLQLSFNS